jgi:hypothetical protein
VEFAETIMRSVGALGTEAGVIVIASERGPSPYTLNAEI